MFGLEWEHDEYQWLVRTSVNDYIAKPVNGSLKQKGEFVTKPDIWIFQSNNMLVIPKAIVEYFDKGTPIEEYVKNNDNIFDYLNAMKIDKKYEVFYKNEKVQRLNRYFIGKQSVSGYLYKRKKGSNTMEHVMKDCPVVLANHIEDVDIQQVDKKAYIAMINKKINTILPLQLNLF